MIMKDDKDRKKMSNDVSVVPDTLIIHKDAEHCAFVGSAILYVRRPRHDTSALIFDFDAQSRPEADTKKCDHE